MELLNKLKLVLSVVLNFLDIQVAFPYRFTIVKTISYQNQKNQIKWPLNKPKLSCNRQSELFIRESREIKVLLIKQ